MDEGNFFNQSVAVVGTLELPWPNIFKFERSEHFFHFYALKPPKALIAVDQDSKFIQQVRIRFPNLPVMMIGSELPECELSKICQFTLAPASHALIRRRLVGIMVRNLEEHLYSKIISMESRNSALMLITAQIENIEPHKPTAILGEPGTGRGWVAVEVAKRRLGTPNAMSLEARGFQELMQEVGILQKRNIVPMISHLEQLSSEELEELRDYMSDHPELILITQHLPAALSFEPDAINSIFIPPLRGRREEIDFFCRIFLGTDLPSSLRLKFHSHDWQFNLAELKSVCELLIREGEEPVQRYFDGSSVVRHENQKELRFLDSTL